MPSSSVNERQQNGSTKTILSLVADETTQVTLSDRPVFGANLTFREDIGSLENMIVYPGQVIGWIDYSDLSKLACLHRQQYFDAQQFIQVDSNQLSFAQTVKIHKVNSDLRKSKTILAFSIMNNKS